MYPRRIAVVLPLALALLAGWASAEADSQTGAYLKAIAQPRTADRITALQNFVASSRGSALELDALELLVWDRLRTGDATGAASSARRLVEVDPGNVVATAVLAGSSAPSAHLDLAVRGLAQLPGMRPPRAMPVSEFTTFKRYIGAMLSGTAGVASLSARDYGSARQYLRTAIASFPENSEYIYSLGVADLLGAEPNRSEGYWYLARAVILTRGTTAGQQISEYAYRKYLDDGGTRDDWSRFLVAANASSRPPAGTTELRAATAPSGSKTTSTASTKQTSAPRRRAEIARKPTSSRPAPRRSTTIAKKEARKPAKKKTEPDLAEIAEEADLRRSGAPDLPPPQPHVRPMPHPGGPVSIGILVGSAGGGRSSRNALLNALSEMVRRLRPGDEAFIMSFGDRLDFEQDLTGNYRLLEQAMDHIPPHSGAKLWDAVAFAAGHLQRIAKNRNRVLLVISDGRNGSSRVTPLELQTQINGIRIDCIGLDASGDGRHLLSSLASHTGGVAQFISDPRQLQTATLYLTQALGLGGGM